MASYGQFCPIARAAEVLGERWTLLVVRELLCGSHRFNDLRRGLPRMSPSLLSQRLKALERAGIVVRLPADGRGGEYHLTEAGQELGDVVTGMGVWGLRWLPDLVDEELDPALLMWDIHRRIEIDRLPPRRVVVLFRFADVPPVTRRWWLVLDRDDLDVCEVDHGIEADVTVDTDLRTMTAVWLGDTPLDAALRSRALQLTGPLSLRRQLPAWLQLSTFATTPRARRAATQLV